ncbi:hypothetical protein CTI12_AA341550 [Artemisia annua]|uniref:Uncharacterized protein n=1 Tax=Artemisia annua TaxID=35608 RepID=A0A2U1MU88_ARTAN|nr:hypothetical protein CTI12_AA341550 [Artemisia annua]
MFVAGHVCKMVIKNSSCSGGRRVANEEYCCPFSEEIGLAVDTYVSAGPKLLDFGTGLIRYETANDVDTLECDADMFTDLGVDRLCEPGTYGVRKRLRTQTPEGECPSHQTRKHCGHMGLSTAVPTDTPSTSSQPEYQTSVSAFVSTASIANDIVPDARGRSDTSSCTVGSTPISNPRITPPHTQPTPASNTRRSRSGPPTEYKRFGPCDCICSNCDAFFWYDERLSSSTRHSGPLYHRCCLGGKDRLAGV